jgi:hypothetical protein
MPVRVVAILWEPIMPGHPLETRDWELFELPEAGSRYWRGRTSYRVDSVEPEETPPRVHFHHDPEWENDLCADLPDDHFVEGAQRSEDGTWQFRVIGPAGRVPGAVGSGRDCEAAITQAIDKARAHLL